MINKKVFHLKPLKNSLFTRTNGFRLIDTDPFKQPAKLLVTELTNFFFSSGPMKFSLVQSFIKEQIAVVFIVQHFKTIQAATAKKKERILIRIELILMLDDCGKPINSFTQIGFPTDKVDLRNFRIVKHHERRLLSKVLEPDRDWPHYKFECSDF